MTLSEVKFKPLHYFESVFEHHQGWHFSGFQILHIGGSFKYTVLCSRRSETLWRSALFIRNGLYFQNHL